MWLQGNPATKMVIARTAVFDFQKISVFHLSLFFSSFETNFFIVDVDG